VILDVVVEDATAVVVLRFGRNMGPRGPRRGWTRFSVG
jgi:hypothetical protein